jgi:hypothetical protein
MGAWDLFLTHYSSENLVAPGIELETTRFLARNSDHIPYMTYQIKLVLDKAIGST